jgi:hypothetical protein
VRLDVTVEPDDDDGYNAKYKYVSPQPFRIAAFQYGMQHITQMPKPMADSPGPSLANTPF